MSLLLPANKNMRLNFVSLWEILIFSVLAVLILIFLFPKNQLLRDAVELDHPEPVTLIYLQNLLSIYPNNYQLTIAMINQEVGAEKLVRAEADLNKLIMQQGGQEEKNLDILWLKYLIMRAKAYQLPRNVAEREANLQKLGSVIENLASAPLEPKKLEELSNDALAIDRADISNSINLRLFQMNALQNTDALEKAAKTALMISNYETSSKFYFIAAQQAQNIKSKRDLYMKGLQALQSGNLLNQAMATAKSLPSNIVNNESFLIFLGKLALASNRPDLAREFMLQAIQIAPKIAPKVEQ